ncbi:MAG TPA: beta-ketoacyl synthase N-terminal-like domain-containing protein [Thermoanaerobaculia bacterium]|nr:beta-ketoacyl synthase N-terminal-like domain-containing protein [Thermoanaerobaculia bacterium]
MTQAVDVIGAGAVDAGQLAGDAIPMYDEGRLRRMDRYGRAGFLAGSLALRDAGQAASRHADPRAGLVFGTALGCRDSITDHARLLAETAHVEDLRPSLFTQTVHNSVVGELAIEWRLGGISEVLVSGRTAGVEALLRAAAHVADGDADRVVAAGAEGMHAEMELAWEEERHRYGARGEDVPCADGGAALVLARSGSVPARGRILGGVSFFEPDAERVAARLAPFLRRLAGEGGALPVLVLASPALDAAFERAGLERAGLESIVIEGPPRVELFAAAGPRAIVDLLRAQMPGLYVVVVRDPEGPVAALGLEVIPRTG